MGLFARSDWPVQYLPQLVTQCFLGKRLLEKCGEIKARRLGSVAQEEQSPQIGALLTELSRQFGTGHAGQQNIGYQNVNRARLGTANANCFFAISGRQHGVMVLGGHPGDKFPDAIVILNQKNSFSSLAVHYRLHRRVWRDLILLGARKPDAH